jgi:hypothetical protein
MKNLPNTKPPGSFMRLGLGQENKLQVSIAVDTSAIDLERTEMPRRQLGASRGVHPVQISPWERGQRRWGRESTCLRHRPECEFSLIYLLWSGSGVGALLN